MNQFFRTFAAVTVVGCTFAIIGCADQHAMGNRSNASEMDRDSRTIPGSINGAGTSTDSSVTDQGRNPSSSGSISGQGISGSPTMPTDQNKNGSR